MRSLNLAAVALVLVALPVTAQQRGAAGPPQSNTGLFAGITLTPAQQKKVDSVWTAHAPMRDKMRAQMQSGERPDPAQMEQMRTMRQQSIASYRALLTTDQQAVLDKNVEAMQARMGGMGGMGAGGAAGQGTAPKQ